MFCPSPATVVSDRSTRRAPRRNRKDDFRIICDCQRHRRGPNVFWRRAIRIASRTAAVLVSVPLAFAAFDIPSSAMNMTVVGPSTAELREPKAIATSDGARRLRVFDGEAVRQEILDPRPTPLSLDVFKEHYFRTHVPYGAIIFREARRNNLPPELIAAMVQTESDFRPSLVSNKSAQGLMQLVPNTARLLGVRDPFDPEQNIAAGTKYFRYLLNRYDNESMALAAYNAGPGNVQRFGGIPPFRETRNYIAKVNRRAHRYRLNVHTNYLATLRVSPETAQ